jgi:altronate dehydratase small subunit
MAGGFGMKIDAIMIKKCDNVATALRQIKTNEKVIISVDNEKRELRINEAIDFGHKFAVNDIKIGDYIIKYGEIMGRATKNIDEGTHAHIHNIESLRGRGDLERTVS